MRDAMCLFLSCCLKETSITSGSCGLCPGWDIGDQYFESRTGHQRCACRTYWCSWLVSANHSKPQCHARMVWVCHSLRKRIPTNYNYNQLVTSSMFCGLLCNVHNSQHSQPIFVHLFVCVCVFFLVFYLAQPTRTKVVMAWSISTFAKIKRPFSFPIRAPYRERSWTLWCVQSRRTNSKRRRQVSRWWHPLEKLWEAFFFSLFASSGHI